MNCADTPSKSLSAYRHYTPLPYTSRVQGKRTGLRGNAIWRFQGEFPP